jgi:zinc protease
MSTLRDTKTDLTRDYESVLQSITREDTRRIIQQLMKQQNHSEVIMVGVEREK